MEKKRLVSYIVLAVLLVLPAIAAAQPTLPNSNEVFTVPASNPTGEKLDFKLTLTPVPDTQRFILGINMDVQYSDYSNLIYFKSDAPGSVMLSTYDDDAYINIHQLRYKNINDRAWRRYSAPTASEEHWEKVKQKSYEAIIGVIPVFGDLYTARDLLYLGFVDQTPTYLISCDLTEPNATPVISTLGPDNTADQVADSAGPSRPDFSHDRFFDIAKLNWHKIDSGNRFVHTDGLELEFELGREAGSTRTLPLNMRVVLPILWIDEERDSEGEKREKWTTYFAELEWATEIPGSSDHDILDSACTLALSGVLDDHYNSASQYRLAVEVNGKSLYAQQRPPFDHGKPYSKIFDNWKTLKINLGGFNSGDSLEIRVTHSGSPRSDWIGVDFMEIACGGKTQKIELGDYRNYGAKDGAAAIVYGGQSKAWTITVP
jgi:hypothetical protein